MEVASCRSLRMTENSRMDSTILDCFTKLVSDDGRERLDGATGLLRHMSKKRAEDGQDKEVSYAVTRLVRGLGSSRALSRRGFYTVLVAYLRTNPDSCLERLLKTMDAELRSSNSNSKSENADINMGRILLCGALIRSKFLVARTGEEQRKIFEILSSAGQSRSYLAFVSVSFLVDFLLQLDRTVLEDGIWPLLKEQLAKPWQQQTIHTFYILLIMRDKFPDLVDTKFLQESLGSADLLGGENSKELLKLLTDIPRIVCCRHPVYKLFCEKIVSSDKLVEFWSGIDERFAKASRSMEYLGLELLKHILNNLKDKTVIPSLLSPNFLHHMIRRFTACKKNRHDEVAITFKALLSQLVSVMNDKDLKAKTHVAVFKKLILYPGDMMIEKTTGTRVLQMLTANMSTEALKKLSKVYQEIASNAKPKGRRSDASEPWTNTERIYAVQLLTRLLGHSAVNGEHKWRLDQLKFLFNLGLCENVSVELAPQFKESFYRALDHKLPKLSELRTVLEEFVRYLNEQLFVNESLKLRNSLTNPAIEAWKAMFKFVTEVAENRKKNREALLIFTTMDLQMALQLFADPEMAISAINEIHSCYDRLNTKKKKKRVSGGIAGKDSVDDEDEPEWVEVIVDLLLSLLSRNSHLLRSVVRCVFPHMCPFLNASSVHQILDVLDPKNDKNPLVASDETSECSSTDEDDDDDVQDEIDKSSEEIATEKGANDDDDSDREVMGDEEEEEEDEEQQEKLSSEDEDSEVDEEDEDIDETMTDRLRMAVRQALGEASIQTDDEDVDVDEIDEEQGKRLDESLAAAFRILRENRQSHTKKQEKSAQTLTHFRVRVIDLLESYIESGPSMALAIDMLVPLFALLEYCIKDVHQKPLENRVRTCLKKLSGVRKFRDTEGVDAESLTEVIKLLMEKGERSTAVCQEMGDKLAECATFLVRCVQTAGLHSQSFVEIYRDYLTAFFKKRDCVLPGTLFKSILQLVWPGNWQLAPLLVDYAFDDSIRSFRRGQALEFLSIFYRNNRLVKSESQVSVRKKMESKLYGNSVKLLRELASPKLEGGEQPDREASISGKKVRQKFVCLCMNLLSAVYPQHLPEAWNWKAIASAIADYRSCHSLSKDAKSAYNKLASQIGAPIHVSMTKKVERASNGVQSNSQNGSCLPESDSADSESEEASTTEKNSKKESKKRLKARSKRKDKQKLKKEARELRAKAMAEGFESFNFSAVQSFGNDTAIEDVEDDEILPNGTTPDQSKTKQKRANSESASTRTKKKRKNSSEG